MWIHYIKTETYLQSFEPGVESTLGLVKCRTVGCTDELQERSDGVLPAHCYHCSLPLDEGPDRVKPKEQGMGFHFDYIADDVRMS